MDKNKLTIRMASISDAKYLLAIYAPYVEETSVSFEYEVPSLKEFKSRISNTLKKYPYLVAILDNQIVGYAYASDFHHRAAYQWSVETSIYVSQNFRRNKIGEKLYESLENILLKQKINNVYACIGCPNEESINFHAKHGFQNVAHFNKCGYKLAEWHDVVWMEKHINDHVDEPNFFIPITNFKLKF